MGKIRQAIPSPDAGKTENKPPSPLGMAFTILASPVRFPVASELQALRFTFDYNILQFAEVYSPSNFSQIFAVILASSRVRWFCRMKAASWNRCR